MNRPFALSAYGAAAAALSPLARPYLEARARAGKEDAARLNERFGAPSAERPHGPLVWLHGASVGETMVLFTVHRALHAARPDLSFLFTAGTQTAAALFAQRAPARAQHQYAPLDLPRAIDRFLAHWRPDLMVAAESEIWPHIILAAKAAGVKLALVNARLSPKSRAQWAKMAKSAASIFGSFDAVLAADRQTAEDLKSLGALGAQFVGNLKLAAGAPPIDREALRVLLAAIGARPCWCAASTHPGEDEILLEAHARVRERLPDALLILAPRHPERGAAVTALAGVAKRRSLGDLPGTEDGVYIADTLGELGVFYAAAQVSFVAGSLLPALRGHNPIEPAAIGSAILTGPYRESFADIFETLITRGGALEARDAPAIAREVLRLLGNDTARKSMTAAAALLPAEGEAAFRHTLEALLTLLPPEAAHARA